MTLTQALSRARALLISKGIEDAALVSELLLMHTLSISRVRLYLELNRALTAAEEATFWNMVERALTGEPVAYITGHREFYGHDFYVNPNVLIPRPETELLVETALRLAKDYTTPVMADIGTGCGAIAVSLAIELPQAEIYATDISAPALEVASSNCHKHGVANRVQLLCGDMLDPLPVPVDFIIANLPYVKATAVDTGPLKFEPRTALDGGPDGLEHIRRLCRQLAGKLRRGGHLLLEIGQGQAPVLTACIHDRFPSTGIKVIRDLNGIERVISLSHLSNERIASGPAYSSHF